MRQLIEGALWAARQTMPFSISGTKKLLDKQGEDTSTLGSTVRAAKEHFSDVALGQLGFQPAPALIQNSPAMNKAREYEQANRPSGTRTAAQAEHQRAMHTVEEMYRTGRVNQDTMADLKRRGALTQEDVLRARLLSRTDPLVRAVRSLTPEQALHVYGLADQDERKKLRPLIEAKSRELPKIPDAVQRQALRGAFRDALNGGGRKNVGGI
jgi:flagellar biosynthesis regulator FlaF